MFDITLNTMLGIIIRTTAIYFLILIGLRLSGKREIGQMTVFDLVVLLLLANAVQNAMVGQDTSLVGGVLAALVLLILNAIIARLQFHLPKFRRLVDGTPTVLVSQGKIIQKNMELEGVDEDTLAASFRKQGVADIDGVQLAVLEIDGSISVVPKANADK